jgi:hypothetical protein
MEKITISKGQIWTKKSSSGKRKDRNYEVKEVFPDGEIDTTVVLRDFDTNNPEAKDAHVMLGDPSWIYRSNASVVEEHIVKRTIDFGEDYYTSTKPKKKKAKEIVREEFDKVKYIPFPVEKETTATGVDIKRKAERQCAEIQSKGKKPTQMAKALANAEIKEKKVVPIVDEKNEEARDIKDWDTFKYYYYDSFDVFASILSQTETIKLYTIKTGFKNGFYKLLHSQALEMWKDGELSLNKIRLKQPTQYKDQYTGEERYKPCGMHNFVIRIVKAIYHFGTIEEKKALFKDFN